MNRKHTLLFLGLLIVAGAVAIYFERSGHNVISATHQSVSRLPPEQTPVQATDENRATPIPDIPGAQLTRNDREKLGKITEAFSAPITFYGKVIDQHGQPVSGATIHYSAADQYFGKGSKYEGASDASGAFSIAGLKGAGLFVSVYKDGYAGTSRSGASFGYGVPSANQPPSVDNPAVFLLRKKDPPEPLIVVDKNIVVPKDGTRVEINLTSGRPVPSGHGDFIIECRADGQETDERGRYDWQCRLTVPGGGLTERSDVEFEFEAPVEGYQPVKEFRMPRNAGRWKDSFEENYFVKLANGSYARMRFRLTTGGDHFASLTSYLNPTPGSRNLEYDSNKRINK